MLRPYDDHVVARSPQGDDIVLFRVSNPLVIQEIASGKVQERPRNDVDGNWSDHETMMHEKFGKDLTPHRVKYRTMKR